MLLALEGTYDVPGVWVWDPLRNASKTNAMSSSLAAAAPEAATLLRAPGRSLSKLGCTPQSPYPSIPYMSGLPSSACEPNTS